MATPIFSARRGAAAKPSARLRLFIALWPDDAVQDALFEAGAPFAALGRRIPARKLHITLAFLGAVSADRVEPIAQAIALARPPVCGITLNRVGHFAKTRIVWAGSTEPLEPVVHYQTRLVLQLARAGLRTENRPYRPHLTLLRDAERPAPEQLAQPLTVAWPVRDVALVESKPESTGARYSLLRRVPAAG